MPDPGHGLLTARGLEVRYGPRIALHRVDLTARPGELLALLGPNGAGKSTLVKALAGLLPHDGSVSLGGSDLGVLSWRERARRLTYVPQRSGLQSALRVEEVVAQGRYAAGHGWSQKRESRHAIDAALQTARAHDLLGRNFTKLSVGEQQRVLIARALATDAPVMLLDEPTAALDVREALSTFALLRELADAGRTLVVVVHGLVEARRFADHAVLLDGGRVVERGPPLAVVSDAPVKSVYRVRLTEARGPWFELLDEEDPSLSERVPS